jgi:hypothetical protein
MRGRISMVVLLGGMIGMIGCDKEVKLTFVNHSPTPVDIQLRGPGTGMGFVGRAGAGEATKTKIKVDKDFLPARYDWQAGAFANNFVVTEDTEDELWIHIDSPAGSAPVDKNTAVQGERKVKKIQIETEEVIVP